MITYEMRGSNHILVRLEGKLAGEIKPIGTGYAYYPKGGRGHGEVMASVDLVKHSLETDDA